MDGAGQGGHGARREEALQERLPAEAANMDAGDDTGDSWLRWPSSIHRRFQGKRNKKQSCYFVGDVKSYCGQSSNVAQGDGGNWVLLYHCVPLSDLENAIMDELHWLHIVPCDFENTELDVVIVNLYARLSDGSTNEKVKQFNVGQSTEGYKMAAEI